MSGTQQPGAPAVPPINTTATIWGAPITAVLCFVTFLACLVLAFVTKNEGLIAGLSATAGTLATLAAQFYFGSSNGSQKKDVTVAAQSAMLAASTPVPPPGTSVTAASTTAGGPAATTTGTAPAAPG